MRRTEKIRAATFAKSVIREMTPVAQSHAAINISQGLPDSSRRQS